MARVYTRRCEGSLVSPSGSWPGMSVLRCPRVRGPTNLSSLPETLHGTGFETSYETALSMAAMDSKAVNSEEEADSA